METAMVLNAAIVSLNAAFLMVLLVLYARMMREVPSRFTLGLVLFAGALLLETLTQLYFYFTMMEYFAGGAAKLAMVHNGLALLASGFLAYVTFRPGEATPRASKPADA